MKSLSLKIPPPIIALISALLIWFLSLYLPNCREVEIARHFTAWLMVGIAAILDMWALLSFKCAKTTIDPRYPHRTSSMVTLGVYHYTRNPMYVGLIIILSAWSVYLGSLAGFGVVIACVLYLNTFQIAGEESALEKLFGDAYLDYKRRVRRWL